MWTWSAAIWPFSAALSKNFFFSAASCNLLQPYIIVCRLCDFSELSTSHSESLMWFLCSFVYTLFFYSYVTSRQLYVTPLQRYVTLWQLLCDSSAAYVLLQRYVTLSAAYWLLCSFGSSAALCDFLQLCLTLQLYVPSLQICIILSSACLCDVSAALYNSLTVFMWLLES